MNWWSKLEKMEETSYFSLNKKRYILFVMSISTSLMVLSYFKVSSLTNFVVINFNQVVKNSNFQKCYYVLPRVDLNMKFWNRISRCLICLLFAKMTWAQVLILRFQIWYILMKFYCSMTIIGTDNLIWKIEVIFLCTISL